MLFGCCFAFFRRRYGRGRASLPTFVQKKLCACLFVVFALRYIYFHISSTKRKTNTETQSEKTIEMGNDKRHRVVSTADKRDRAGLQATKKPMR